MNQQLPVNVLRRGPIMHYTIQFQQHKNVQDFYQESVVDDFLNSVSGCFAADAEYKIQGYVEVMSYQLGEIINMKNTSIWLVNVYTARHFNSYVRGEIKK